MTEITTQLDTPTPVTLSQGIVPPFGSMEAFSEAHDMARALCWSTLVPKAYQGENNIPNCLIAMEMAARTGTSILAVMQSLDVIHGTPTWRAQFIIGLLNSCGRFEPLQFRQTGKGDRKGVIATAVSRQTGETLESIRVTVDMAKHDGWWDRKGSKWPHMTDLMLRYRAAAFFGRLHAADLLLGMSTTEEMIDVGPAAATVAMPRRASGEQPTGQTIVEPPTETARPLSLESWSRGDRRLIQAYLQAQIGTDSEDQRQWLANCKLSPEELLTIAEAHVRDQAERKASLFGESRD